MATSLSSTGPVTRAITAMRNDEPPRRNFLAAFAGLAAAPVLHWPTKAQAGQIDEILSLVARFEEADRVYADAWENYKATAEKARASVPSQPETLRRSGDFRHFWGMCASQHSPVYYDADDVSYFRTYKADGHLHRADREAALARAKQIVEAYESWEIDLDEHDYACGLNSADDRCEIAVVARSELETEVLELTPHTLEGFRAKARVARIVNEQYFTSRLLDDLVGTLV